VTDGDIDMNQCVVINVYDISLKCRSRGRLNKAESMQLQRYLIFVFFCSLFLKLAVSVLSVVDVQKLFKGCRFFE
jgi:hypothetical protein